MRLKRRMVVFASLAALTATVSVAQDAAPQTLFTNVHVFDGVSDTRIENASVLIEGNLIKEVSTESIDAPEATMIDGGGRTLMPGLIDSHVHLNLTGLFASFGGAEYANWDGIGAMAVANARDYLMDGYTTVRDACGQGDAMKKLIDQDILVGPRIYPSGACIGPQSGHTDWRSPRARAEGGPVAQVEELNLAVVADGVDEITSAARRNLSYGATQIKLTVGGGVSSELDPLWSVGYSVEEIKAAVDVAAFNDTYAFTHAYTDETVQMALDAGVKVIEHGQMVTEETVKRMADEGVFWSLNTAGFSPILFEHPNFAPGTPAGNKLAVAHDQSKDLIDLVKKYKPKVVHNVDTVLSSLDDGRAHRDFEKYQFADWFGNHAMLMSATSTPGELAQLTGQRNPYPEKLGVIEAGAYADILIVDGNPLEDVSVLGAQPKWFDAEPREEGHKSIRVIMKDGKFYKNTLD
ncbi:amidohydrolase family protein [Shimia thalassica]|uniref:metal-dependent hydrolase family protein n=1 Tax=Shimia thalassica TaxID=1715693 RepID=UPI001C09B88A|nr:amidohydrolase family protein [Shimia thalassica]MBU2943214.1 amidohydrolase family protein [Shimia thalassica]MDO6501283.1 amidohydrolase family protein [Shimia thalassica]